MVRLGCDALRIQRRGVHGFRGTAAGEFNGIKRTLRFAEVAAGHEVAQWLGHSPHRAEVMSVYVRRASLNTTRV